MQKLTFDVAKETVEKLQTLSATVATTESVINNYLNQHIADSSDTALSSVVFQSYQNAAIKTRTEYEHEKDVMFVSTVPEETRKIAHNWDLNFYTGVLTVFTK